MWKIDNWNLHHVETSNLRGEKFRQIACPFFLDLIYTKARPKDWYTLPKTSNSTVQSLARFFSFTYLSCLVKNFAPVGNQREKESAQCQNYWKLCRFALKTTNQAPLFCVSKERLLEISLNRAFNTRTKNHFAARKCQVSIWRWNCVDCKRTFVNKKENSWKQKVIQKKDFWIFRWIGHFIPERKCLVTQQWQIMSEIVWRIIYCYKKKRD